MHSYEYKLLFIDSRDESFGSTEKLAKNIMSDFNLSNPTILLIPTKEDVFSRKASFSNLLFNSIFF